jgi:hypothetical protein
MKKPQVNPHTRKNIAGWRFGRLLAICPVENAKKNSNSGVLWKCKCDCGNIAYVLTKNLTYKKGTRSCGCLQKEASRKNAQFIVRRTGIDNARYKHGMTGTRLYMAWLNMKSRCVRTDTRHSKNYALRGISVCSEWANKQDGFVRFMQWAMANGYADNLTLDRIDNNGNYEPNNCRWVTNSEQQHNRSNNVFITFNNKTQTMNMWAKELNMCYKTLEKRIRKWGVERAFTEPIRREYQRGCCK